MVREFYLIVNKRGAVRTTKGVPGLYSDEISIKMKLQLPDEIFTKPMLMGSIILPADVAKGPEFTAKITNTIKNAIEKGTDLKVELKMIDPNEEKKDGE